nr:hypothetical protein [uncultured bacterium]
MINTLLIKGGESSELGSGLPELGLADERREGNLSVALSRRSYAY